MLIAFNYVSLLLLLFWLLLLLLVSHYFNLPRFQYEYNPITHSDTNNIIQYMTLHLYIPISDGNFSVPLNASNPVKTNTNNIKFLKI